MNIINKIIELTEQDTATDYSTEQANIDKTNDQALELQIKGIDEQIKLLQTKKQQLLVTRNNKSGI